MLEAGGFDSYIEDERTVFKMADSDNHIVNVIWDNNAAVYIATSESVPGLILESGSFDALVEKVRLTVPELLNLNNNKSENVELTFMSERHCIVSNG